MSRLLLLIVVAFLTFSDALARVPVTGSNRQTGGIAGRVTIDGRAVPDAVLTLMPMVSTGEITPNPPPPISAKTDQAGYYMFTNVPAKDWYVRLREPEPEPTYVFNNGSGQLTWGIHVTVAPGQVSKGVNFDLTRGAVITGRILDERGQPMTEGWVTCLWFDPKLAANHHIYKNQDYNPGWRAMREPIRPDEHGGYRFSGLATGNYRIAFEHESRERYEKTYHPDTTDQAKAFTVEVKAGLNLSNLNIQLRPRPRFTASGVMVDAQTNQPLSNHSFGYYQMLESGPEAAKLNEFIGYSGLRGEFQIGGLLPGKYVAYLGKTERSRDLYCDPIVFEIQDRDLAELRIQVYRGASISGRAVIEGTTDPAILAKLSGLRLNILHLSRQSFVVDPFYPNAEISSDGSFRLSGLPPGKVRIQPANFTNEFTFWSVERDGREQPDFVVDLKPGEQLIGARIVIAHSTGAIRGQIKVEGEPTFLGRWMIFLNGVKGAQALGFMDQVDENGRFLLDGLASGTYTVSASRFGKSEGSSPFEDGTHGSQTITVVNGKETPVTIIIKRDGNEK